MNQAFFFPSLIVAKKSIYDDVNPKEQSKLVALVLRTLNIISFNRVSTFGLDGPGN
jgi:hypothetical protein